MSESSDPGHHKGSSDGMRVLSYLLAGPLCYGGIGWLVDHFWLHSGLLLPIGVVVGMVLSIILIIRRHSVAP
ncbi:AtpZ/AtpI family protein [Propionibacteriaceae bacterium Y1700]|uniref:AtpZ/AtpI family protein n=1 Tax=Microlunatus sp. Y1700 TaxID=3418487 RepID=UPI003DA70C25